MPIELDDRGQALENEYFRRQEQELIAKMKAKLGTSETTEARIKVKCQRDDCTSNLKEVDFENVRIDVCQDCSGVWLDAGELAAVMNKDEEKSGWLNRFFG